MTARVAPTYNRSTLALALLARILLTPRKPTSIPLTLAASYNSSAVPIQELKDATLSMFQDQVQVFLVIAGLTNR
ncbi:hypothetical protein D3C73_1041670 [compost metagenome]